MDESRVKNKTRYLITSALNDTDVNQTCWSSFKAAAKKLKAQLIVVPTVYKNPNLSDMGVQSAYSWPREVKPYLAPNDLRICKNLYVRGSVRIGHTAINPLGGMNHAGGLKSEIFGHAQVAMQTVPVPHGWTPKLLHTTGTVSVPQYGQSWTAQKAAFHHSHCAVFIETEGDDFWFTQVHFDGKGAQVYDRYFTPAGEKKATCASAISLGDLHFRFLTENTSKSIDKIIERFCPKHTIYHDAHDQHIGSHHNEKSVLFHMAKNANQEFSIRDELLRLRDYFDSANRRKTGQMVVVDSNHNRHLDQWFDRFDPRKDPVNVDLYFELGHMSQEDLKAGGDGNPLRLWLQKYTKKKLKFVGPNDNFILHDVDLGQHGDVGPNGARGSAKGFARTGMKTIIGHTHSPCIEKGCYQGGVAGRGAYAKGYSSWLTTHTVLTVTGKRLMVTTINDKLPPLLR